ncbi:MAG TPA: tryptophan synthase subunit alpha, partial [Rhodocyclaceae bacterium]
SAAKVASVADAVVIGSRIIEEIENSPRAEAPARVTAFLRTIREAMDNAAAGGIR